MSNKPRNIKSHPAAAYKVGRIRKRRRKPSDVEARKRRKKKRTFWKTIDRISKILT